MNGLKPAIGGNSQSQPEQSIRRIFALEDDALRARSRVQRFGDTIATQAGRPWCIVAHAAWFGVRIIFNSPAISGASRSTLFRTLF
jgi:hypothetical protein